LSMTTLVGTKPNRSVLAAEASSQARARFRSLVDAHVDAVWRTLRRLGMPRADLDDGVQLVFTVLARRLDLVEHGKERSFLLGVALRTVHDWRRTRRRRPEVPLEPGIIDRAPASERSPERLLDERRRLELLDELVGELPRALAEVFVLAELEELSMAEIAQILAIPAGTVASRLRKSRQAFAELCRNREHTHERA